MISLAHLLLFGPFIVFFDIRKKMDIGISILDLLQSKETAQYCRIGTNSGSTPTHQDLCEKDSTDQLANLANPPSTISHISINNILGRSHRVAP